MILILNNKNFREIAASNFVLKNHRNEMMMMEI